MNELIKARDEYIELIKKELLGPGSEISIPDEEHEIITNAPEVRYSIGVLFPQENKINAESGDSLRIEETAGETDEEDAVQMSEEIMADIASKEASFAVSEAEEDNLDEEIGLAAQNMPSSMGITFFVEGECSTINCDISFATYRKIRVSECRFPFSPENPETYQVPLALQHCIRYDQTDKCLKLNCSVQKKEIRSIYEADVVPEGEYWIFDYAYKLCDQLRQGYVREPHHVEVELIFAKSEYIDNNTEIDGTTAKITALRRRVSDNVYSITIMLVNALEGRSNGTNCLFQPKLTVCTENNNFSFCQYNNLVDVENTNEEEKSLELLYRNKKVYGTGLGTSLEWEVNSEGKGKIFNEFFPKCEVPSMDFNLPNDSGVQKQVMSMKYLSDLNDLSQEQKIEGLRKVVRAYENWIEELNQTVSKLHEKYKPQALKNIHNCELALGRMYKGLELLSISKNAWNSFILANRAMFMQREQLEMQETMSNIDRYPGDEEVEDKLKNINYYNSEDKHFWRPFQIAFLLLSVESIVNDKSDDRNLVDLIWFPTGGGKTEAYLGLTAFTIFYRRFHGLEVSGGTSVMMRYTLRLLAAQQFTRASTLICACEFIRRDSNLRQPKYNKYALGTEKITIGLWIGGKHTPNKINGTRNNPGAVQCLNELLAASKNELSYKKRKYNKFQVLKCPWCGTKLVKEIVNNQVAGQWGYKTPNNNRFYMSCPHEECYFNDELPIQVVDEELYKNPPTLLFGTVDKFAMLSWKYDIGAFFAEGKPNRTPELIIQDELHLISGPLGTMVGLYETAVDCLCETKGVRPKIVASTATIRRAKEQCSVLYNREVSQFPSPGIDADNSFFARESKINYEKGVFGRKYVGLMPSGKTKAMMQVRTISALMQKIKSMKMEDDLKDKLWTLTVYFNSLKDLGKCSTLIDDDVKDFIKRMAYRLGTARDARLIGRADELTSRVSTTELNETLDKLEKLCYSKVNIENKRYASNVLLATNMISVGIDVARLNAMLLVGQPKLTSEYIQASSRIGRSFPGVAFILYDGSKSRDRSHYEQFKSYHESFYRYVEPTGATPFSKPARERALHAIILAIMRHIGENLGKEKEAGNFRKDKFENEINYIKQYIINRTQQISQRAKLGLEDESVEITAEIENFFADWDTIAKTNSSDKFFYGERFMVIRPDSTQKRLLKIFNSAKKDTTAFDTMTSMRNVDSTVASNILIWED